MNGVNKVILLGRVGRDPEIRYTNGGAAVANFSVATSERWKDKQTGEMKEMTEWSRIVAFGRLAEIVGEYLAKGARVYIEGSMRTRQWERDGQTHYTTEINARELQLLDKRSDGEAPSSDRLVQSRAETPGQRKRQAEQATSSPPVDFDDDIPF